MPIGDKLSEQKKIKSRLEILKTWMSSFVMGTAAIVMAIILIPSSPKASILNVTIFQTEVVYQVEITDQDESLDLDSLTIVLSNQFVEISKPLEFGMNVGMFDQLSPNTLYSLSVYGSKGFGNERLDVITIKTEDRSGGAIISQTLVETFEWNHHYSIEVLVKDQENLYGDIYLYYAYLYEEELDPVYVSTLILNEREIIELLDVPIYNNIVHLYLEAELLSGGFVVLDELYFAVPFQLETSIYLEHIDQNIIEYSFYPDYSSEQIVNYTFDLYYGKQKVDTKEIIYSRDENVMHTSSTYVSFEKLREASLYHVIVSASYQNPITLRRESIVLLEEDVQTLGDYEIDFQITKVLDSYEVYVYLNDPNHYFQNVSYILYDMTGEFPSYIESMSYGFIPDGDGKYQSFSFNAPNVSSYQMMIRVFNNSEYMIYHIVFDETIKP